MMNEADPSNIQDAQKLTSIFGNWPSFHDAEILSLLLDRGADHPFCEIKIHVFRVTNDVDASGHYVLRDHTVAKIRFNDIRDLETTEFNHQNVIDGMVISLNDHGFAVSWNGSNGSDARFVCKSIRVLDAKPFTPEEMNENRSIYARRSPRH